MTRKASNNQKALFADQEQFLCGCGCGQYGFRRARGRKREYINQTHKKRAQRARQKAVLSNAEPKLTAVQLWKAKQMANRDYSSLWENLTAGEQWVVHLAAQHPEGYEGFWQSIVRLTKRQDSWWSINVGGNQGLNENVHE